MRTEHITRCPHCAAVFRLRPEQLHAAQGWLRCAQCQQAFDASARLVACAPEAPPPQRLTLPVSAAPPAAPSDGVLAFAQALASFPRPALGTLSPAPASVPAPALSEAPARKPSAPARRRAWLFGLGALLLALLLAQAVWASRALWSVHWPVLGHAAQALCERLACVVPPWREPRVLVLEHARLVRTESGFDVHWSLHNTAAWPLLMPAFELTLLDAQEQVLARRVLSPEDSRAPRQLAAQEHWSGHLAWPWPADAPVASYRLLVFYP